MKVSANKPTHSVLFAYGYALGEFGFTFFLFFVSYYLMVFLTDILRLPMTLAAVLYSGVQWLEAVTMIYAGIYIDRRPRKSGQFRPWIVIGSIILLIGTVLFYTAFDLPVMWKAVLFVTAYLVAYWGYNLMWVAYRSLLGPLGRNPQDTIMLNSASAQMGSVAGLCFSFVCVRLLNGFSTPAMGYTISALVYGGIIVICMLVVSRITRPFDNGQLHAKDAPQKPMGLADIRKVFSRPMCVFFIVVSLRESASTVLPSLLVYYFTYVMNDPGLMSIYLSVVTFSGLIGHFFGRKLANVYGKKPMFIVGSLAACICILSMRFTTSAPVAFLVLVAVKGFFEIFSGAFIPAFMMEIADYNEYVAGVHARAFSSSIGGTALRFSQILGGAIASFGLVAIGYSSSAPITPEVVQGISDLMIYGSTAIILASVVVMLFYKVDPEIMQKIYEQRTRRLEKGEVSG